MTELQRLTQEYKAKRRELRQLALSDDSTTEAITEGEAALSLLEKRCEALKATEPDPEPDPAKTGDSEGREVRRLAGKARVGAFVAAALTGQPVKGASAEYAAALGMDGMLPLSLLEPEGRTETRAVTPGPSDETVTSTRPTVPYAFERTDAAALGVTMPTVAPGEAHFPALTTAPPAGPKAEDAAADATAAAFTLTKRTPTRITGQFTFRREDQALFPAMESDMRRSIGRAIADSLDKQVVNGDGTAPNLTGLFGVATDVSAAGSVETFATGVARVAALVDGTHANGWGDIRLLLGSDTFSLYSSLFQSNINICG